MTKKTMKKNVERYVDNLKVELISPNKNYAERKNRIQNFIRCSSRC